MFSAYGNMVSTYPEENLSSSPSHEKSVGDYLFRLILLLPLVLDFYPTIAGLARKSVSPVILGRYSASLALYNLYNVGAIALLLWGWKRRRHTFIQIGYILIVISSFYCYLTYLPEILLILYLIRLTGAVGILAVEFDRHRNQSKSLGIFVSIGIILAMLSVSDAALFVYLSFSNKSLAVTGEFRDDYSLKDISANDIVIVGDSFVWGYKVSKEDRFVNKLEDLYRSQGKKAKVYGLGKIGGGLTDYIQILQQIPAKAKTDRIVMAFYMNDMPSMATVTDWITMVLTNQGAGPSFRFIGDQIGKLNYPTVDSYHEFVIRCCDKREKTFPQRWGLAKQQLTQFRDQAIARSNRRPVIMIIPIMVDFRTYPLEDTDRDLFETASALGYEVIDLLPIFRDQLKDGAKYRVTPDDNHFNAATHALVAQILAQKL